MSEASFTDEQGQFEACGRPVHLHRREGLSKKYAAIRLPTLKTFKVLNLFNFLYQIYID